jgi:hypothetical protein
MTNEEFQYILDDLTKNNLRFIAKIREAKNYIYELKKENAKLKEALEFYADINNWKDEIYRNDTKQLICFSDLGCRSYTDEADLPYCSGGRRAREVLKELYEQT